MRLLYLHNSPLAARQANVIQAVAMCQEFGKLGLDVTLAVPEGEMPDRDGASNLAHDRLAVPPSFEIRRFERERFLGGDRRGLGSIRGAARLLRAVAPDVVYLRNPHFLNAANRWASHVVFESHSARLHNRNFFLHAYWKRRVVRSATHPKLVCLVAISEKLADFWRHAGISPSKIVVEHDAVDKAMFEPRMAPRDARAALGIEHDRPLIVYAGSLKEDRGIEQVLPVALTMADVEFLIVGGPDARVRQLQGAAKNMGVGNVQFAGWVDHARVNTYLFAADVLLMLWTRAVPTINYCSPLKLFEYMAAGKPIVGPAFPTITEVLRDGDTAYLFAPDDGDGLGRCLRQALCDPEAREVGERARRQVMERHTWGIRAGHIVAAMRQGIAARGR